MRTRSIGAIARSLGYAAVAATIVAAAFHFRQDDPKPREAVGIAPASATNSLARELAHCQAIGMAAKGDAACAAAWAESRQRFFSYTPPLSAPAATANAGSAQ
jgi:conjugative transfer region protein TrbK